MLLGLAWYWWLIIGVVFLLTLPIKMKLLKKMSSNQKSMRDDQND